MSPRICIYDFENLLSVKSFVDVIEIELFFIALLSEDKIEK